MKVRCEVDSNGRVVSQVSVDEDGPNVFDGIILEPCYVENGLRIVVPPAPSPYHVWDWTAKQWVLTLQAAKDAKWDAVKAWRDARNYAPFTWGGYTFDADDRSRARIAEAGLEALMIASTGETQAYEWVLYDNTTATLTEAQMLQMSRALRARTNQLFLASSVKRQQIEAATTVAAVEAITMPPDPE